MVQPHNFIVKSTSVTEAAAQSRNNSGRLNKMGQLKFEVDKCPPVTHFIVFIKNDVKVIHLLGTRGQDYHDNTMTSLGSCSIILKVMTLD